MRSRKEMVFVIVSKRLLVFFEFQPTEACSWSDHLVSQHLNISELSQEIQSFNQRPAVSTPGESLRRRLRKLSAIF